MQTSAVEELESVVVSDTDMITYISIENIIIDERKRDLSEARATVLADSIKTIGLLQPIVVIKDDTSSKYRIVAGRHRVRSFEILGNTEIPAVIKDYNILDKELAEIDENLCRFDLTEMERSIQVARRKEIYGVKFPSTLSAKKREELREKWEAEGRPSNNPNIPDFASEGATKPVKSFVEDTAEKTGRSTTKVRDEANLGAALLNGLAPEIRDLLAPTPSADNKSHLQRLVAETDPDIQYDAAKAVRDSYDEWEANGKPESERTKLVKLGDALDALQKNLTYENTISESGEDTLHKTLQKTMKALELSVGNTKFTEVAETWTYEGLEDIREDFYRIESLSTRGADILTKIMDAKTKLGKGKK